MVIIVFVDVSMGCLIRFIVEMCEVWEFYVGLLIEYVYC